LKFPLDVAAIEAQVASEVAAGSPGKQNQFARGVALGRSIGDIVVQRGRADGFRNADGTPTVWDSSRLPTGPIIWRTSACYASDSSRETVVEGGSSRRTRRNKAPAHGVARDHAQCSRRFHVDRSRQPMKGQAERRDLNTVHLIGSPSHNHGRTSITEAQDTSQSAPEMPAWATARASTRQRVDARQPELGSHGW
jgi:hypothetical protein